MAEINDAMIKLEDLSATLDSIQKQLEKSREDTQVLKQAVEALGNQIDETDFIIHHSPKSNAPPRQKGPKSVF